MNTIPFHLRKYIVDQQYERYTPMDQAVWRFILRQLKNYLKIHAHPSYAEGLAKTGISTERIPNIQEMSQKMQAYGWTAVPVSGFIPPAAFMEMQSLGILPIASDMRSIEHLAYTPAPDIVHEAAGHAPLLVDSEYTAYLQRYAQVARKAILNHSDIETYEAIRQLSDLKENPHASEAELKAAYERLEAAQKSAGEPSEGALLARMNWWTAEYGLIGDPSCPLIYGAGLLSSVGESYSALQDSVEKIPFSLECLNFNYDITERQPQLFVTSNFQTLGHELDRLAQTLAFQRGGQEAIDKAIRARVVTTLQLDSGLQISGIVVESKPSFVPTENGIAAFRLSGPVQLSVDDRQLQAEGLVHDIKRHAHGFSSPLGFWKGSTKAPYLLNDSELNAMGIQRGKRVTIQTDAGVSVTGVVKSWTRHRDRLVLMTFDECTVKRGTEILYQPEWGEFDFAIGTKVTNVFGGPADREAYGETDDFVAARVVARTQTPHMSHLNDLYSTVRALREVWLENGTCDISKIKSVLKELDQAFSSEWLLRLEGLELLKANSQDVTELELTLKQLATGQPDNAAPIRDGLALSDQMRV